MTVLRIHSVLFFLVIVAGSCISPYEPPITVQDKQYLVVDAFMDSQADIATVRLAYTVSLSSTERPPKEESAVVTLTDDQQSGTFLFQNKGNGEYQLTGINFTNEKKYQLHIRTSAGKEYESELITLLSSPPIDSLTFTVEPEYIQVHVNTHDATGTSRYYKWECEETFEYRTAYLSGLVIKNRVVMPRTIDEYIDRCWRTDPLFNVNIRSTVSLTEDRVSNFTLRTIRREDIRISRKYSLYVRQQTLSEEAFEYWTNVKQTTESLGGLFDPVPSQVIGNIRCISDPNEPVIGYFSGGSMSDKRIFISREDLPNAYSRYRQECPLDTVLIEDLHTVSNPDALLYPLYNGPTVIGWTTTSTPCFDCRDLAGGKPVKPDFWE